MKCAIKCYRWLYFFFTVVPHFIYSSTYSLYVILLYRDLCYVPEDDDPNGKTMTITCHFNDDPSGKVAHLEAKRNVVIVTWYWLLIFTLLYIAKEVNRIAHFKREIFKHLEFYIDLVILLSFIFISPWEEEWRTGNMIGNWKNFEMPRWNYHVASIGGKNAIFLGLALFSSLQRKFVHL